MDMNRFELTIFSLQTEATLIIEASEEISDVIIEFMAVFATDIDCETHKITIESIQQNSTDTLEKVNWFVDKYKSKLPKLNQFKKSFEKIHIGKHFVLLPNQKLTTELVVTLGNLLDSKDNNKDFDELTARHEAVFKDVINNYELITRSTEKKNYNGEGLKINRICRFCDRKYPDAKFSNEAHAISEALGNKCIIVNDECDECNSYFDENIERDIICYLSLYVTHFGIRGKHQVPKIKGANYVHENIGNNNTSLQFVSDDDFEDGNLPQNLKLKSYDTIAVQNIYKALCKFALSIIDRRYIDACKDTIKWLKTDNFNGKLPKIAVLAEYHFFKKHPEMLVYIRKNDNKKLPYMVGEFQFTYMKFVFIIPFSSQDDNAFVDEENYNVFWESFTHYNQVSGWKFMDFSNSEKRNVVFNMNFVKNEDAKNISPALPTD